MVEFSDPDAERRLVQILWLEFQVVFSQGAKAFDRANLLQSDFTDRSAVRLFDFMLTGVRLRRSPIAREKALSEYLQTEELLSSSEIEALADRIRKLASRRAIRDSIQRVWNELKTGKMAPSDIHAMYVHEAKGLPSRSDGIEEFEPTVKSIQTEIALSKKEKRAAVLTGFRGFDREANGLHSTLVVLAGMPGCGKSAVEASIIRNMAKRGERSLIFCMEDHSKWLGYRLLAREAEVPQSVLRFKEPDDLQQTAIGNGFVALRSYENSIMVCNRQRMRPAQVLETARTAIWKYGVRAIWLDNMTAMQFERSERRDLEIQDFLADARDLAVESGVPFVVLSHIKNRDGTDEFKMPFLKDCSESGAFSKLCRQGMVVWRRKDDDNLNLALVKSTNGKGLLKFELKLDVTSATIAHEIEAAKQAGLFVVPNQEEETA